MMPDLESETVAGETRPVLPPKTEGETVIVKYNAGNVRSVACALDRLGVVPVITDDPVRIREAGRVIFPGVGEAASAMNCLRRTGLDTVLRELDQPFLGICLGMQLMCRKSAERDTECLGIFDVDVLRFPPRQKVPHMGWNTLTGLKGPLFSGIGEDEWFYFVHSYYAGTGSQTIAGCDYILAFSAALQQGNYFGVQFHPEKSGSVGEAVLKNFLASGCRSASGLEGRSPIPDSPDYGCR